MDETKKIRNGQFGNLSCDLLNVYANRILFKAGMPWGDVHVIYPDTSGPGSDVGIMVLAGAYPGDTPPLPTRGSVIYVSGNDVGGHVGILPGLTTHAQIILYDHNGNIFVTIGDDGTLTPTGLGLKVDGRLFGKALHNNAQPVTGTSNQYIASGTYTPTLFNTTNISASVAYACQWMRVGNVVTVSGKVDVTTTATVATLLGISLPIASALTAAEQCAGTAAATQYAGESAAIIGDAANDRASMSWITVVAGNHNMFFTFTYVIL